MKYIICDIDGTVGESKARADAYSSGDKNWELFYADAINDKPVDSVCKLVRAMGEVGYGTIFITGRSEKYREDTLKWLIINGLDCIKLFMREENDYRPDHVIKREIYERIKEMGVPLFVLDDRSGCVKMWRDLGLTCLQVRDGDY